METKKGANRFVIMTKDKVYKFASMRYFFGVARSIPRMLKNGDGSFILKELRWGWINFTRGVHENFAERQCWKRMRSPFLSPTLLNTGIFCVSKRQYGTTPSQEELWAAFNKLPDAAQKELKELEAHCLEPSNFIKTHKGYVLIDYDNGTSPTAKAHPFSIFLERWHKELEQILIPQIPKANIR